MQDLKCFLLLLHVSSLSQVVFIDLIYALIYMNDSCEKQNSVIRCLLNYSIIWAVVNRKGMVEYCFSKESLHPIMFIKVCLLNNNNIIHKTQGWQK